LVKNVNKYWQKYIEKVAFFPRKQAKSLKTGIRYQLSGNKANSNSKKH